MASPPNCSNLTTSVQANTTFVQADPSNFRTIVQKLTGAPSSPEDGSLHKPPVTGHHHQNKPSPKRLACKLHERRQVANNYNKLNLNLNNSNHVGNGSFLFSPVSTLDVLSAAGSSPGEECRGVGSEEAEERAIAEKGFYLHPVIVNPSMAQSSCNRSPTVGEGGGGGGRELLPLFPLEPFRDEADD